MLMRGNCIYKSGPRLEKLKLICTSAVQWFVSTSMTSMFDILNYFLLDIRSSQTFSAWIKCLCLAYRTLKNVIYRFITNEKKMYIRKGNKHLIVFWTRKIFLVLLLLLPHLRSSSLVECNLYGYRISYLRISNLYAVLSFYPSTIFLIYCKLWVFVENYYFLTVIHVPIHLYKILLDCILDSGCYFQVGNTLKLGMPIPTAYRTALDTWASWVEKNINTNWTHVFFWTFEPSHWRYAFDIGNMMLCSQTYMVFHFILLLGNYSVSAYRSKNEFPLL